MTTELISLWQRTLGTPPSDAQFVIWTESHPSDIVRSAILKTASKNQMLGGTMSPDHKIRFASKVMLTLSAQRKEHAVNRAKLAQEFTAKAGGE
jgi:hypothetical protein